MANFTFIYNRIYHKDMKRFLFFVVSLCAAVSGMSAAEPVFDGWALPVVSVAHMRGRPAHSAEMVSQVLMGMPLRVAASEKEGWLLVKSPEGYSGYVIKNSLQLMESLQMARWRSSKRLIATALNEIKIYADTLGRRVVSDIVPGDIVEDRGSSGRWAAVVLPDGRKGWANRSCFTSLSGWAVQPESARSVISMAMAQTGAPYVWGGMSVKGMDCSGLSKMAYYHNGIILRRDASQQALCGKLVENMSDLKPGDLLFFGNKNTGKVDHVGIFIDGDNFIESSGRVRVSSVKAQKRLLYARRVLGYTSDPGITRAVDHAWYFNRERR